VKLGVLSHVLPPSTTGQAVVLYRLLSGLDPESYCLIASPRRHPWTLSADIPQLPARTNVLPGEARIFPIALVQRAWNLARILRKERCSAVLACSADLLNLPAAYLASRIAGVPFFIFMMDHYSQQWFKWRQRLLAGALFPYLVRAAKRTLVLNEYMAATVSARGGVPVIVRAPCEPQSDANGVGYDSSTRPETSRTIVFAGAVYEANFDSFERLLRALRLLSGSGITLQVYSDQRLPEKIASIAPDLVVQRPHQPLRRIPEILRSAGILFLPLAFSTPYPEVIRTSSPSKLGDYLESGRPILAHVPPDSFIASFFRERHCGSVVDVPEVEALASEIALMFDDFGRNAEFAVSERLLSQAEFSAESARKAFLHAVESS
jgi:hypothetical protein